LIVTTVYQQVNQISDLIITLDNQGFYFLFLIIIE